MKDFLKKIINERYNFFSNTRLVPNIICLNHYDYDDFMQSKIPEKYVNILTIMEMDVVIDYNLEVGEFKIGHVYEIS